MILVDNALNESMLNPKLKIQNIQMSPNKQEKVQIEREHNFTTDEAQDLQEITNGEDDRRKKGINVEDKSKKNTTDGNLVQMVNPEVKDVTNDIQNEGITTEDEKNETNTTKDEKEKRIAGKSKKGEKVAEVRKSQRIRKQRMVIHPDQIGNCDDTQDLDYK